MDLTALVDLRAVSHLAHACAVLSASPDEIKQRNSRSISGSAHQRTDQRTSTITMQQDRLASIPFDVPAFVVQLVHLGSPIMKCVLLCWQPSTAAAIEPGHLPLVSAFGWIDSCRNLSRLLLYVQTCMSDVGLDATHSLSMLYRRTEGRAVNFLGF